MVIPPPDAGVPITEFDTEPRPAQEQNIGQATGPIIEVARGEVDSDAFSFVVHRSAAGACTFLNRESSGSGGCGPLPGEGLPEFGPFGMMATTGGSDLPAEVIGLVSGHVASVRVEMEDGTSAQARLGTCAGPCGKRGRSRAAGGWARGTRRRSADTGILVTRGLIGRAGREPAIVCRIEMPVASTPNVKLVRQAPRGAAAPPGRGRRSQ